MLGIIHQFGVAEKNDIGRGNKFKRFIRWVLQKERLEFAISLSKKSFYLLEEELEAAEKCSGRKVQWLQ